MPRVPVYDSPQVELRGVTSARHQAAPVGNDLIRAGSALQSAANDVGNVLLMQQEQRNADRLFAAEAALKDEYLQFETTLRERRGQSAWGVTTDAAKWFDEAEKRHVQGLENDRQRNLFKVTMTRLRQQGLDSASRFESEQRRISLEESGRASITNSINVAAASPTNPDAISGAKADILQRVQVLSQLNGWSPERRAAEEAQHLTNLHKQIIQARIDMDPDGASEYFEANKAEIAGADQETVRKLIEQGTLRKKAQTAVDAILAQGLSESAALAEARKQFSGAEEDEVVTRLKSRFAEAEAIRNDLERKTADEAWNIFARTGTVSSLPTELLNRLDGRTLNALKNEERSRITREVPKTDWELFYDLRQEATANPQEFARMDLRQHFDKLAPEERRSLMTLQQKIASPDEAKDVATLDQQLKRVHQTLGWTASDLEKRGAFDSMVYEALDVEQKAKGRKLDFQERQAVIDRMLIEGEVTSGRWYLPDSDRRFYEVAGTEDAANFVPKIPDDERRKIEAALTRAGRTVDDESVMRLFKMKHGLR